MKFRNLEKQLFMPVIKKVTPFLVAATLGITGVVAPACGKPDENPPIIQNYQIAEWTQEDEDVELKVNTLDDRGVEQVYVQFESGENAPLIINLTKTHSEKNGGEKAEWELSTKLPPKEYVYSIVAKDTVNETEVDGKISVYQKDADGDGLSYRDELKYGTDLNKKNPVVRYLLDKNLGIYVPQLMALDEDEVMDDCERAFIDVLSVMDKDFAEYVVKNKLTFGDGNINELELNFLREPDKYTQQLFNHYISEVEKINPELGMELKKLPDFKNIEINGIKKLEGLEDLLVLAGNPEYKSASEIIVNEGVKDKRKYCSPLEGLLWIAYDVEPEKFSVSGEFSLEKMMINAWKNTTTSRNYTSKRWENFDEVVNRLNSPRLIAMYMINNISFSKELIVEMARSGRYVWMEAEETFKMKKAICSGHSVFALYCLLNNGFHYNNFDAHRDNAACVLSTEGEMDKDTAMFRGHATCMYSKNSNFYTIDVGKIHGPFKTVEEAANTTTINCNVYRFVDINGNVTKEVRK